jgi:deoxyribodipyrimidine photo-lyase
MSKCIFWFRRDLRLHDNAGFYHALRSGSEVIPIFIFDKCILNHLDKNDARVTFLHDTITDLKKQLNDFGSDLYVYYGEPQNVWNDVINDHQPTDVYYNHDFESYAQSRDCKLQSLWKRHSITWHSYKDHVIFEKSEIVKDDGKPYTVFTPYKRKWLAKLMENCKQASDSYYFKAYPSYDYIDKCAKTAVVHPMLTLKDMGFERSNIVIPSKTVMQSVIKQYDEKRNFPSIEGTSKLGIHFRFGTISIREKAANASLLNDTYLSELIWRDFYAQILYHFPHVEKQAFRPEYDRIIWRNDEKEFTAWCEGKTGYPIVDAGMRELMHTGHMHNRVRMIVASFLTKHLLIDWRWGEAWFARHLLDFDLASNNGGWQWAAGCGTDAAPYFRIFSPDAQTDKFDKHHIYIKKWVPEYGTAKYPQPLVDHKMARERCLSTYKLALNS